MMFKTPSQRGGSYLKTPQIKNCDKTPIIALDSEADASQ